MNPKFVKWAKAAGIRALYTFVEVALGYITVGACISDIKWGMMFSVGFVAAIYSLGKSVLVGLPEVDNDLEDEDNGEKDS